MAAVLIDAVGDMKGIGLHDADDHHPFNGSRKDRLNFPVFADSVATEGAETAEIDVQQDDEQSDLESDGSEAVDLDFSVHTLLREEEDFGITKIIDAVSLEDATSLRVSGYQDQEHDGAMDACAGSAGSVLGTTTGATRAAIATSTSTSTSTGTGAAIATAATAAAAAANAASSAKATVRACPATLIRRAQ